jgi:two-component system, chemotaxis family, protein-glutamate methylesterase/glutaminase
MAAKIRVSIVDDSLFVRKAVQKILESDPRLEVVGNAASGEELLENLDRWNPDVVTLDLSMPGMGGLPTLDRILEWKAIPVLILSTQSSRDAPITIEALYRGAVDFIDKQQYSLVDFGALRAVLIGKILQFASGIKPRIEPVVQLAGAPGYILDDAAIVSGPPPDRKFDIVVIGASAGGPPALEKILDGLKEQIPVPIAIVQHMPVGFIKALVERLSAKFPFSICEAINEKELAPNHVYFAPSGFHLRLEQKEDQVRTILTKQPENAQHRPSVDIMFSSAASVYRDRALAVLLTGMGVDGAQGMLELKKAGAHTIAQSERSCVIYGMPRAAVEIGAVRESVDLSALGNRLKHLLQNS